MRKVIAGVAVAAAVAVTVVKWRGRRSALTEDPDRWHSVTILKSPEELGHRPTPLDELDEAIEVRIRPAPGDRGTELSVRPAGDASADAIQELRRALRAAKQLAEVGEVLLPDSPPTTDRTLTGKPLEYATTHGRRAGRL
jgi:hypothetical protein